MAKSENSPWNLFEESLHKYKSNVMLIHNQKEFTYSQIYNKVLHFSQIIDKLDFTVAGIYLPNGPEFIYCMLSLNRERKPVVYLSYQFKGEVLAEMINYSDIEVLVTDEQGYREIEKCMDKVQLNCLLVYKATGFFEHVPVRNKIRKELKGFNSNTFGVCFTSGSTARPKGILLSNRAITGNAIAVAEFLDFKSHDRTLVPRSFAQASPISGDILMAVSKGGSIIILNDLFHPAIFLKAVQDYKATTVFMIRTMLSQILDYPQLATFDLSSLKKILLGGMINPNRIFQEAENKLKGISLFNAYGISEASARVSFAEQSDLKRFPGTIGKPMKGCDIKIYREDGTEAAAGEIGELYVISDYVMDGYYKSESMTKEALTPMGLRTRDTGYRDENNLFYVIGRSDDLIIQGGNKVYPIDVEEVLLKHPAVAEVAVLGIPDDKLGKRIVALLSLKYGCNAEIQELYRFCRQNLEDKKVPKEIHIVNKIPRNSIGKISKTELQGYYQSQLLPTGRKVLNHI
ncbi:MAG: acyl-CoA synthetase (AMP-forming)/AMP-acid ligase [Eubacterium sp.]|jgi:long-chain acyl-CoA synthetase|nr:acyl-CoA synthetase (AMP-forming)/AMP-acid ligase [Eubacterium sp.]